jgi:hypothetical protein
MLDIHNAAMPTMAAMHLSINGTSLSPGGLYME